MSASTTSITALIIPGAAVAGGPAGKAASALGGFEALMGAFFAATDGLLQAEAAGAAQPLAAAPDGAPALQPATPGAAILPLVGEAKPVQTPGKTAQPDATVIKDDAAPSTDAAAAVLAAIAVPAVAAEAAPDAAKVVKVTEAKDDAPDAPAGATTDAVPAAVLALLAPAQPVVTPPAKVKAEAEPAGGSRPPQIAVDAEAPLAPPPAQAPVDAAPQAPEAARAKVEPNPAPDTPALTPIAAEPAKAAATPAKAAAPAAEPAAAPVQPQSAQLPAAPPAAVEAAAAPPPAPAAAAPASASAEKPAKTRTAREAPADAAPAAAPRPGPAAQAATAIEPQADKDPGRKSSGAAEPLTAEAAPKAADPQAPALDAAAPAPASSTTHAAAPPPAVRGAPETVANLAAQIAKKLGARTTQFDVQLDPAGLGRVNVRVEINADGRVSAAMSFDNPQAAADLKSRANELQRALAQSGFDLSGGLSFDVAQDQGNPFAGQQNAFQGGENTGSAFRGRAFAQALETADAAESALASARGYSRQTPTGVDVRI